MLAQKRKRREEVEFCHDIWALVLSYAFSFSKSTDLELISQTLDKLTDSSRQKEIPRVILLLGAYPSSYYLYKRAKLFEKVCLRGFVSYADWLLKQRNLPIGRPHMLEVFPKVCATGNLDMVQFLVKTFAIPFNETAFRQSSAARKTQVLQWMLEHYKVQDQTFWRLAGFSAACTNSVEFLDVIWTQIRPISLNIVHKWLCGACEYGQLEVVEYLLQKALLPGEISSLTPLSPLLSTSMLEAFRIACCNGHRQVAQVLCDIPGWLLSQKEQKEKEQKEEKEEKHQLELLDLFVRCCKDGHLQVVEWLVLRFASLFTGPNKDKAVYKAFQAACTESHVQTAKWLQVHLEAKFCPATFALTCQRGHLEIAQWLVTLCPSIKSDTTVGFDSFIRACCFNHVQVAAWIESCFHIPRNKIITGYLLANIDEKKEITQWLVEKYSPDIRPRIKTLCHSLIRKDDVSGMEWVIEQVAFTDQDYWDQFYSACLCNALKVAQWIVSKMEAPFNFDIFWLTEQIVESGDLSFVQWFLEFFQSSMQWAQQRLRYLFDACIRREKWDVLELLIETCPNLPKNILTSYKLESRIRSKSAACYILPKLERIKTNMIKTNMIKTNMINTNKKKKKCY